MVKLKNQLSNNLGAKTGKVSLDIQNLSSIYGGVACAYTNIEDSLVKYSSDPKKHTKDMVWDELINSQKENLNNKNTPPKQ